MIVLNLLKSQNVRIESRQLRLEPLPSIVPLQIFRREIQMTIKISGARYRFLAQHIVRANRQICRNWRDFGEPIKDIGFDPLTDGAFRQVAISGEAVHDLIEHDLRSRRLLEKTRGFLEIYWNFERKIIEKLTIFCLLTILLLSGLCFVGCRFFAARHCSILITQPSSSSSSLMSMTSRAACGDSGIFGKIEKKNN